MSNLQKLFQERVAQSLVVESVDSIAQDTSLIQDERFVPNIDFSDFANFVHYGNAEDYATRAISWIYGSYPYDGSRKEKEEWYRSGSAYDNYLFDNEYPKSTGYVTLDGTQYVRVAGGPNVDNVFESGSREANIALTENGMSIECWLNVDAAADDLMTLVDISNTASFDAGEDEHVRFTVSLVDADTASPYWSVWLQSGSDNDTVASSLAAPTTGSWSHHAFVLSGDTLKFYVDGELADTQVYDFTPGTALSGLHLHLGATVDETEGLIGSVDEFRFWKVARNAEQISQSWFTSVHGGTNTQDDNLDLGVYFKFNEGIVGLDVTDSVVLDYAGRASNGVFVNYDSACRSTGSALDAEVADPIMYSTHPDVIALMEQKQAQGQVYDSQNANSFVKMFPAYLIEEDEETGSNFKKILQILSSYLDELHVTLEQLPRLTDSDYVYKNQNKPLPFAKHLLTSYGLNTEELFADAELLETIGSRNDSVLFEKSLRDVKNTIYHRLYDNLIYIFKSKGSEAAIRSALHCFGVDDELYRLVVNADNETVVFDESSQYHSVVRKRTLDNYDVDRFEGTVIQTASAADEQNYVAPFDSGVDGAMTFEVDVVLPEKLPIDSADWFLTDFLTASVCGYRMADVADDSDYAWDDSVAGDVLTYRDNRDSNAGRFCFTGTFGELVTDTINDLYDDSKWHVSVRLSPDPVQDYVVSFDGYKYDADTLVDSFNHTASIATADARTMLSTAKRFYVGSLRQDFTGSAVVYQSDVRVASFDVWNDLLSDEELTEHAKNVLAYGRSRGSEYSDTLEQYSDLTIKSSDLCALRWDFELVTGSDALGRFDVLDLTSSSIDNDYGFLSESLTFKHPGVGMFWPENSTEVVDVEFLQSAKTDIPGNVGIASFVKIRDEESERLAPVFRPIRHHFALEKSMYRTISEEILKSFAAIVDFNNLIGMPLDRYKGSYDRLRTLRERYFAKVTDRSTIERFTTFYKWLDSAVVTVISNLIPATTSFSAKTGDVIESHVLERNKIQYQLPVYHSAGTRDMTGVVDVMSVDGDEQVSVEGTITMPSMSGRARAFEREYANVQTSGRKENNLHFRDHSEDFEENYIESPYVEGLVDYPVPQRERCETVFVERFASPGGADVMSAGTMDRESEEYSVYNALPYRNLPVRLALSKLEQKHSDQFGIDSEYGAPSASYCKTNKNVGYVAVDDETVEERYDNDFVGHAIPQNDLQYAWITASAESAGVGYAPEDGMDKVDGEFVPFIEFAQPAGITEAMDSSRFGYPSWKQLRVGERADAVELREGNLIVLEQLQRDGSIETASYHEPSVSWNSPMRHRLVDKETGQPAHLVYPYSNQKERFSQPALEDHLWPKQRKNKTLYDDFSAMYLGDEQEVEFISLHYREQVFPRSVSIGSTTQRDKPDYDEVAGTGSNGYDRGCLERRKIWADDMAARGRSIPDGKNAFDKEDFRNSVWPLDDNDDESETGVVGKGGELNNTWYDDGGYRYTAFTGQDDDERMATASALYCHNSRLNLADAFEVGMPAGQVLFEESEQTPAYDSYSDFSSDLRPMSQRYGFVPEYRVSEHMQYFVDENGGNFRKSSQDLPIKLDGVAHSASSDVALFGEHAYTDDLKDVSKLLKDHENFKENSRLTLTCSGLKKLLPYNGFYPQHRTVQLASLFSSSFADHIEGLSGDGTGTESIDQQDQWKLQSMLQPWFAPGIVFNSIKAGLAVDWPTYMGVEGFNEAAGEVDGGKAIYLDGVDDYLRVVDDGGLVAGNSDWLSLSFWFKPKNIDPKGNHSSGTLLARANFGAPGDVSNLVFRVGYALSVSPNDDSISFMVYDGVGSVQNVNYKLMLARGNFQDGQWHHVAIAFKANVTASIWIDGVSKYATANVIANLNTASVDLTIGNYLIGSIPNEYGYGNFYIDEIAYYTGSVRLNSADAASIYAGGRCPSFDLNTIVPPPTYWWKMGDGDDGFGNDDGYDNLIYEMQTGTLNAQMTGSTIVNGCPGGDFGFLSQTPNFRVPFESLFSFGDYVPASSSAEDNSMYFVAPEWYTGSSATTRYPYFLWNGEKSNSLFEMAAHNFFGEVPRFTLNNDGLEAYVSAPSTQFKPLSSGTTYYMDVTLNKTSNFDMIFSLNSGTDGDFNYNGRYFGPAMQMVEVPELYIGTGLYSMSSDPAYAAYAPSYLYGKAVARISFTPSESRQYSLDEIQAGMQIEYINDGLVDMAYDATGEDILTNDSPLWSSSMNLTASIEVAGKAKLSETEHSLTSNGSYVPTSVRNVNDSGYYAWAIYPKFECPTLNFHDLKSDNDWLATADYERGPYGMWLNEGRSLQRNEGIWFSLEESFKRKSSAELAGSGSLIDVCGFTPSSRRIGEVANNRVVHEAVVAIPFVDSPIVSGAKTTSVSNHNFFAIDKTMYTLQTMFTAAGKPAVPKGSYGAVEDIQSTTITDMHDKMRKYYLPPELDFVTYPDINPFVMYMFEFTSNLSKNDMENIWQGLMPSLAKKVEKEDVTISHALGKTEFFGGEKLPDGVRWLLFKVKQRAEKSYYNVTADSKDDSRFQFDFKVGKKEPEYNYNWPYDFFSLVESVSLEAGIDIAPTVNVKVNQEVVGDVNNIEAKLGSVALEVSKEIQGQKLNIGGPLPALLNPNLRS